MLIVKWHQIKANWPMLMSAISKQHCLPRNFIILLPDSLQSIAAVAKIKEIRVL